MKSLLLSLIAIFTFAQSQAQYTFSTFTDSYGFHINATEIIENDYDENIWDDPEFEIELDFSFPVADQEYTSLVQIGAGASLMLTNATSNTIFSYNSDLIDGEIETPLSPSTISYLTVGDIGSRIFKVQYDNCGFHNAIAGIVEGTVTNRINFQMWFYETGVFEMRFGLNSISDSELVHDGSGPVIFLITEADLVQEEAEFIGVISGDPSNPILVLDPPVKSDPPTLNGDPSNGRVYRFEPSSLGLKDEISINNLKLFPTQANQTIFISGLESTNTIFHISDITGKIQMSGMINQSEGIDISKLTNGFYLFQVEGYSNALKFVKL